MTLPLLIVLSLSLQTGSPQTGQRIPVPSPEEWPLAAAPGSQAPTSAPGTAQDVTLVFYDVRDLIDPSLRPGMEQQPDIAPADLLAAARLSDRMDEIRTRFVEVLSTFIEPPLEEPHHEIRASRSGPLIAALNAEQHVWLQNFLNLQRQYADEAYLIDIRFVAVPPEAVHAIGLLPEGVPVPSATAPDLHGMAVRAEVDLESAIEASFLGDVELAELLRRLEQQEQAEIVSAPRILTLNGTRAEILVMNQVAYVADYEVHEEVEPLGETVVDPVVEVVQDGTRADCQVVRLGPDTLGLVYRIERHDLERPIASFETAHGTIGLPEVTVWRVSSALALADGDCAVLPPFPADGRLMSVLIQATAVEPEALAPR